MKISTVQDIQGDASGLLNETNPVLVTRDGRLAGIFFPRPEITMPIELKRELFHVLAADVARQLAQSGSTEQEVLTDFSRWRKKKRENRRRR